MDVINEEREFGETETENGFSVSNYYENSVSRGKSRLVNDEKYLKYNFILN